MLLDCLTSLSSRLRLVDQCMRNRIDSKDDFVHSRQTETVGLSGSICLNFLMALMHCYFGRRPQVILTIKKTDKVIDNCKQ